MPMYLERLSAVNGPDMPATQVAATQFCLLIMTVPPGEVELSTRSEILLFPLLSGSLVL